MFGTERAVRRLERMHRKGKGYRILVFGQWLGVFGLIQGVCYATSIARCTCSFDASLLQLSRPVMYLNSILEKSLIDNTASSSTVLRARARGGATLILFHRIK